MPRLVLCVNHPTLKSSDPRHGKAKLTIEDVVVNLVKKLSISIHKYPFLLKEQCDY